MTSVAPSGPRRGAPAGGHRVALGGIRAPWLACLALGLWAALASRPPPPPAKRLAANFDELTLHADTAVAAYDRDGPERLPAAERQRA